MFYLNEYNSETKSVYLVLFQLIFDGQSRSMDEPLAQHNDSA